MTNATNADTTGIEQWNEDDVDAFEVHLVYDRVHESPSDESLAVAAPDKETAIEEARRVSKGNPPKVGPVYNEGDQIPPKWCDNDDRY